MACYLITLLRPASEDRFTARKRFLARMHQRRDPLAAARPGPPPRPPGSRACGWLSGR